MIQLPAKGQLRYNPTTDNWEIYDGLYWRIKVDDPRNIQQPWTKWYAWRPVKVNNRWNWFKTVYRKPKYNSPSLEYTYGTILDVLKEA